MTLNMGRRQLSTPKKEFKEFRSSEEFKEENCALGAAYCVIHFRVGDIPEPSTTNQLGILDASSLNFLDSSNSFPFAFPRLLADGDFSFYRFNHSAALCLIRMFSLQPAARLPSKTVKFSARTTQ